MENGFAHLVDVEYVAGRVSLTVTLEDTLLKRKFYAVINAIMNIMKSALEKEDQVCWTITTQTVNGFAVLDVKRHLQVSTKF